MRILIVEDSVELPDSLQTLLHGLFDRRNESASGEIAPVATRLIVSSLSKWRPRGEPQSRGGTACVGDLDLDDQPELLSTILDALGLALLHRGCVAEARPLIERGLEIRRKFYGDDHPATAASLNSRGRLLRQSGDFKSAESDVRRALTINSRIFGGESLPVAINLNDLAVIQIQLGEFSNAEQSAQSGLRILEALHLQCTDPNVTRLMDSLARVHQTRGNYEKATAIYEKVLELDSRQVGEKHVKYATHLINFATVKTAQGKLTDAKDDLERAIGIFRDEVHRPRHPNLIDAHVNLATVLRQLGDLVSARQNLDDALKLDIAIRGADHPFVGNDHARIGCVDYEANDHAAAATSFAAALAIYDENVKAGQLPADHAYIAEARTWLGRVLVEGFAATRAAEAEGLLEAALRTWQIEFGERSVEQAICSAVLGRTLSVQGKDPPRARILLEHSYPIVAASRGENSKIALLIRKWIDELQESC